MMNKFYTYLHCKPDLTPFYVGKGFGDRAYRFTGRNQYHQRIVAKCGGKENIQILVFKKDSEESAFQSEIRLIRMLRKAGFELANHTDGGEGASGFVKSEETKAKIAIGLTGNKHALGRKQTPEACAKVSAARKGNPNGRLGKKLSAETRAKQSASSKSGTPEVRAKLAAANTGKKASPETRLKQSVSAKARHAKNLIIM